MRTNIVIDDELMAEVLAATGLRTKREAVEAGLRLLARQASAVEELWGLDPGWGGGVLDTERVRPDEVTGHEPALADAS